MIQGNQRAVAAARTCRAVRRAPFVGTDRTGRARDAGIGARRSFVGIVRARRARENEARLTVGSSRADASVAKPFSCVCRKPRSARGLRCLLCPSIHGAACVACASLRIRHCMCITFAVAVSCAKTEAAFQTQTTFEGSLPLVCSFCITAVSSPKWRTSTREVRRPEKRQPHETDMRRRRDHAGGFEGHASRDGKQKPWSENRGENPSEPHAARRSHHGLAEAASRGRSSGECRVVVIAAAGAAGGALR